MGALYIIGGIVLFVLVIRSNTARKRDRQEDRERLLELSSRISKLEETVRTLEGRREEPAATQNAQEPAKRPTPDPQSQPLKAARPQPTTPYEKDLPVTTPVKSIVTLWE